MIIRSFAVSACSPGREKTRLSGSGLFLAKVRCFPGAGELGGSLDRLKV